MIQDRFGTKDLHQTASVAIAHFGMTHHFTVIIESVHEPAKWVHSIHLYTFSLIICDQPGQQKSRFANENTDRPE
jgi:hypothetical protein